MPGPLEGYRIVDLTAIATGPFATMMLADPDLHRLAGSILKDLLIDNTRLQEFLKDQISDTSLRQRMASINDQFQLFFNKIGNILVYEEQGDGINPDLARLLRILLLKRDQRFLFMERGSGELLEHGETFVGIHES